MDMDEVYYCCFVSNEGAEIRVNLRAEQGFLPGQIFSHNSDEDTQKGVRLNVLARVAQD
jgi:hypothetical protein